MQFRVHVVGQYYATEFLGRGVGGGGGGGSRRVSFLPKSGAYFLREFCVSTLVGLRNENKLKDEADNTFCVLYPLNS